MTPKEARELLAKIEVALLPIVNEYHEQLSVNVTDSYVHGMITSIEALNSIIDPALDLEWEQVIRKDLSHHTN